MELKKNNNRVTNVRDSEKSSSDKRRKLMPKIVSLLVSFCIWFYVVSVESPIVEKTFTDIPIKILLADNSDLEVFSGLDNTVNITVKGKKSDLRMMSNDDFEAVVDLSGYRQPETYNASVDIISPSSVTVVEQSKKELDVFIDNEITEFFEVEVEPVGGSWDANVTIDKAADPARIEVKGPGTVVKKVKRAVVLFDFEGNINSEKHADLSVELRDENDKKFANSYLKLSDSEVRATISPMVTRPVSLGLSVEGLDEGDYSFTLEPATVDVKGVIGDIEKNDPYIINCELDAFNTFGVPITLPLTFNEGITPLDAELKEVTAAVELNFEKKSFNGLKIEVDAPSSMQYKIAGTLDISVDCIPSRMNNLNKKDIKLSVDLGEYKDKQGSFKVPVKIELPSDFEKITQIPEYSVNVEITEG